LRSCCRSRVRVGLQSLSAQLCGALTGHMMACVVMCFCQIALIVYWNNHNEPKNVRWLGLGPGSHDAITACHTILMTRVQSHIDLQIPTWRSGHLLNPRLLSSAILELSVICARLACWPVRSSRPPRLRLLPMMTLRWYTAGDRYAVRCEKGVYSKGAH